MANRSMLTLETDHPQRRSRFRKKQLIVLGMVLIGIVVAITVAVTLSTGSVDEGVNKDGKGTEDGPLSPPDPLEAQPPSWSKLRKFKRGAVCVDGVPCALIGKSILDRNGSAVDAALAAMICNGLINMQSMGFGGGFLMTIYEKASKQAFTLNARDCAPGEARQDMYDDLPESASKVGALAITVPGELAGYWEAHQRFGKLPWSDLFQPSIELCENGYNLTQVQYTGLNFNKNNIHGDPTLKEMFVDPGTGEFRRPGSIIRLGALCKTMKIIAEKNATELYNGTLGHTLVEDLRNRGSILTVKDLNDYRAKWEPPISTTLSSGETVYSVGSPGSGALLALILNIIDGYKFTANSIAETNATITTYHRLIEAYKHAYAMRVELGDAAYVDIADLVKNLTSREYADAIRNKISDEKTWNDPRYYGAVTSENFGDHGTAHVSVLAPNGDAVSVTSSVNLYFGSGVVSRRTGILMNSGMDDFGILSRRNFFGLPPSQNNLIEAGKRPLSSMAPTILTDHHGDVRIVVGAAGGTKITTAIAFVVARHLWMNNTIKEAVDAARIHHQLFPMKVIYEYGVPKPVIDGLQRLGHVGARYRDRGSVVCALVQLNGTVYANADYRKGGDVYGID